MGSEGMDMTTFWIDGAGRLIGATSDPKAQPAGAVTSTEIPPDSAKHQTWDGAAWVDDGDRATQEQRRDDLQSLRAAGKDAVLVLVEMIDWQLTNTAMQAGDFTPAVRQAYLDLKVIADRIKT